MAFITIFVSHSMIKINNTTTTIKTKIDTGEHTGLVVRVSDSGSGDLGSIILKLFTGTLNKKKN